MCVYSVCVCVRVCVCVCVCVCAAELVPLPVRTCACLCCVLTVTRRLTSRLSSRVTNQRERKTFSRFTLAFVNTFPYRHFSRKLACAVHVNRRQSSLAHVARKRSPRKHITQGKAFLIAKRTVPSCIKKCVSGPRKGPTRSAKILSFRTHSRRLVFAHTYPPICAFLGTPPADR